MIVDLEKLKKVRTAVGTTWTTMSSDHAFNDDFDWLNFLLLKVIDDLELGRESIIKLERRTDGTDEGTEAGSDTASSS